MHCARGPSVRRHVERPSSGWKRGGREHGETLPAFSKSSSRENAGQNQDSSFADERREGGNDVHGPPAPEPGVIQLAGEKRAHRTINQKALNGSKRRRQEKKRQHAPNRWAAA